MSDAPEAGRNGWVAEALRQHEAALLRYALKLTGKLEWAQDVVQETFLRLCREEPEGLDGHLAPWLYRVCRHRALDLKRREHHMNRLEQHSPTELATSEPSPPERTVRRETAGRVAEMLESLTENQQEVVRLRFQHGLSYRQISEITDLSVSHVGVLLHTALKALRTRLSDPETSTGPHQA